MLHPHLAAIARRRAAIARELAALCEEDAELDAKLNAMEHVRPASRPAAHPPPDGKRPSQKQLVLDALRVIEPAWTDTASLVTFIEANWRARVPRLSIGPLLSVMKSDGLIVREGRRICDPKRTRERVTRSA